MYEKVVEGIGIGLYHIVRYPDMTRTQAQTQSLSQVKVEAGDLIHFGVTFLHKLMDDLSHIGLVLNYDEDRHVVSTLLLSSSKEFLGDLEFYDCLENEHVWAFGVDIKMIQKCRENTACKIRMKE